MTPAARRAIDMVLRHEGGLVDHPKDPGGITNFGISLKAYPGLGRDGIRHLTREEAASIYHADYWRKVRGDDLPAGVALVVMDAAVNSGVSRSIQWLQQAVGVGADGALGAKTLAAVAAMSPTDVVRECCEQRLKFLRRLSTWETFGKGWARRVEETLRTALAVST